MLRRSSIASMETRLDELCRIVSIYVIELGYLFRTDFTAKSFSTTDMSAIAIHLS